MARHMLSVDRMLDLTKVAAMFELRERRNFFTLKDLPNGYRLHLVEWLVTFSWRYAGERDIGHS